MISIVDDCRQYFKSAAGLAEPWATERQTPLTHSFCQHVVVTEKPLRIEDARQHPLLRSNQAVKDLNVIAYLGMPIRAPSGLVLGSLCAIDSRPRKWTPDDEATLADLASIVEDQLGQAISQKRFQQILNTMPQMVWSTLPDGYHDFYNDRWYEFTGVPYGSTDGEGWNEMFHAEDRDRAWASWRHSLATGRPYEIEYRLRHHSGAYRWTLGRALPILDTQGRIERWFGTCTDIHDLKEAEAARDLISRELSHRIQNIFAAVHGLTSISARKHPAAKDFAQDLVARIQALSRAHRYVQTDQTSHMPVHGEPDRTCVGLISTVLAPYQEARRVRIEGPDAPLASHLATPLALILHELATNSLKYGSLSVADGALLVSVVPSPTDTVIRWTETGGPQLDCEPETSGFGSLLVGSMIATLDGAIARTWARDGLSVEIRIPMSD